MEKVKNMCLAFYNENRPYAIQLALRSLLALLYFIFLFIPYYVITSAIGDFSNNFYAFKFDTIYILIWFILLFGAIILPILGIQKFDKLIRVLQFVLPLIILLMVLLLIRTERNDIAGISGVSLRYGLGFFLQLIIVIMNWFIAFKVKLVDSVLKRFIPDCFYSTTSTSNPVVDNVEVSKEEVKDSVKEVIVQEPINEVIVEEPINEVIVEEPIKEVIVEDPIKEVIVEDPINEVIIEEPIKEE
jgi:lipid-A-disaccharide synthase-like uncharacterized protein